jgi:alpha-beta hydrolase superfamily lysophospholipase
VPVLSHVTGVAGAASSSGRLPPPADPLNPVGIEVAGIRMVPVVRGKYKVWTKRIGSGDVKVLLLHGGPGAGHAYLEAMESFLPQAGIEIYYYDQLGCNNSDVPDDPSLWTLPRYLEEVEEVRRGLGLEQFVLYGHSWGGILALEYAYEAERGDSEKGSGQKSSCHAYRNSLCDPRRPSDPIQSRMSLSQPSRLVPRPPWDAREISRGSQAARSCPTWLCDS